MRSRREGGRGIRRHALHDVQHLQSQGCLREQSESDRLDSSDTPRGTRPMGSHEAIPMPAKRERPRVRRYRAASHRLRAMHRIGFRGDFPAPRMCVLACESLERLLHDEREHVHALRSIDQVRSAPRPRAQGLKRATPSWIAGLSAFDRKQARAGRRMRTEAAGLQWRTSLVIAASVHSRTSNRINAADHGAPSSGWGRNRNRRAIPRPPRCRDWRRTRSSPALQPERDWLFSPSD